MEANESFATLFWSIIASILIGIGAHSICLSIGCWLMCGLLYGKSR